VTDSMLGRRDFLKASGASALGAGVGLGVNPGAAGALPAATGSEKAFPQLAMLTRYSPQKLAFAGQAGYQGVVITLDDFFDPDKLSDSQIDQILATARNANVRIISIECMWGMNHIASDPAERQKAQERFIRCLQFGHRLGCKFVGTFSGGTKGATTEDQIKDLADVLNEKYMPVCDKLGVGMGPENYPTATNFATTPGIWAELMQRVPNHHFGLEFDPSHLVRQFIDPIQTAWNFKDRILAVHAKDTEIIQPVLQQTGIHGKGWWRYRIPGQGLINWPQFITVLLQAGFGGGMAVEHEDEFWDEPPSNNAAEFPQARKDGFILARRFLDMYVPGRAAGTL
jgi:sugar phosphate isomerase/epimerase